MSLPYYRFFTGDYAKDTRHLSMLQHGAYRQLIDLYMESGGQIANDLQKLQRLLRAESVEEKAAVEFILAEFFELSTGRRLGWIHKRCDRELEWREEKTSKAVESAKKRWVSERNANAERTQSDGNAIKNKIYNKTNTARESARNPQIPWWETSAGTEAKGLELGLKPRPGEDWSQFKGRIFVALQKDRESIDTSQQ
jgi:uncharacterized protein YdaU (DUF1376 family)